MACARSVAGFGAAREQPAPGQLSAQIKLKLDELASQLAWKATRHLIFLATHELW